MDQVIYPIQGTLSHDYGNMKNSFQFLYNQFPNDRYILNNKGKCSEYHLQPKHNKMKIKLTKTYDQEKAKNFMMSGGDGDKNYPVIVLVAQNAPKLLSLKDDLDNEDSRVLPNPRYFTQRFDSMFHKNVYARSFYLDPSVAPHLLTKIQEPKNSLPFVLLGFHPEAYQDPNVTNVFLQTLKNIHHFGDPSLVYINQIPKKRLFNYLLSNYGEDNFPFFRKSLYEYDTLPRVIANVQPQFGGVKKDIKDHPFLGFLYPHSHAKNLPFGQLPPVRRLDDLDDYYGYVQGSSDEEKKLKTCQEERQRLDQEKQNLNQQIQNLNQQNQQARQQIQQLNNQIGQLNPQAAAQAQQIVALQNAMQQQLIQREQELKNEQKAHKDEKKLHLAQINQQQVAIANEHKAHLDSEQNLQNEQKKFLESKKTLEAKEKHITQIMQRVRDDVLKIKQLELEEKKLNAIITALEKKNQDCQEELKKIGLELKTQTDLTKQEIKELRNEQDQLKDIFQKQEEELKKLRKEKQEIEQELQKLRDKNQKQQDEIKNLTDANNVLNLQNITQTANIQKLETEFKNCDDNLKNEHEKYQNCDDEKVKLQQQIKALEQKIYDITTTSEVKLLEFNKLIDEIKKTHAMEMNQLTEENKRKMTVEDEQQKQQFDQIGNQLKLCQEELQTCRKALEELQNKLKKCDDEKKNAETFKVDMDRITNELKECKKTLLAAQALKKLYDQEIEKLKKIAQNALNNLTNERKNVELKCKKEIDELNIVLKDTELKFQKIIKDKDTIHHTQLEEDKKEMKRLIEIINNKERELQQKINEQQKLTEKLQLSGTAKQNFLQYASINIDILRIQLENLNRIIDRIIKEPNLPNNIKTYISEQKRKDEEQIGKHRKDLTEFYFKQQQGGYKSNKTKIIKGHRKNLLKKLKYK